jgi:hypothetical protein
MQTNDNLQDPVKEWFSSKSRDGCFVVAKLIVENIAAQPITASLELQEAQP